MEKASQLKKIRLTQRQADEQEALSNISWIYYSL